jgi:uncharacterized protein YraI
MFPRAITHSNNNSSSNDTNDNTTLFNQIEAGGDALGATNLSRRAFMRRAAGAGVAALAVGALGGLSVKSARASAGSAKATDALNLRSGPSTSHQVLRVIPAGGTVVFQGDSRNGFSYVVYDGTYGWAYTQYLSSGGGQQDPGGGLGGNGRTTVAVNFREGPSLSARVIAVLPAGTPLFVHDEGASGFWSVSYNGQNGWIYADYIQRDGAGPAPGGPVYDPNMATTTAALNLRAEPSTSAKVILVMPAGAQVVLKSGTANGWRQVMYNGKTGWAATQYLN